MNKYEILEKNFGFKKFKYPQDLIIDNVYNGIEVIGLLPTGFGKSMIYQVLALMLEGMTIVVTPLISLMEDQLLGLRKKKIPATMLNSCIPFFEQKKIYQNLLNMKYKILYISPERLSNVYFLNIILKCRISMLVVDEAHTMLWADGFREAFGEIGIFLNLLEHRPRVLAVTATATKDTIYKIKTILRLKDPKIIETSMDRKNLIYKVMKVKDKKKYLKTFIKQHGNEKGIVYCLTRKKVEELYTFLKKENLACTFYHGGLDSKIKQLNQSMFTTNQIPWLICTNAFGMGIDISNIRYVIAFEMPQSLEDLVQQMGRAARDGGYGEGIVLFSFSDIKTINYFIEHQTDSKVRILNQKKRDWIKEYCLTHKCRHMFIGKYFNQNLKACKNKCDNCLKKSR